MHNADIWGSIQDEGRFLEFLFVYPEVVASTISYVFSSTSTNTIKIVLYEALILFVCKDANLVWMLLLILLTNGKRVVCGAILSDDNLDGQMTFLRQDAIKRSPNRFLLIISAYDDGYEVLKICHLSFTIYHFLHKGTK
jgi:hypothetical protein